jgi:hypothetical protein
MATRSKVVGAWSIRGEEAWCVPQGLKPLHAPLPLAGGLVGILQTILEIPVLAMFYIR